jgi:hypothetical protein
MARSSTGVIFKPGGNDKELRRIFEDVVPELARLNPHVRVGGFLDEKGGGAEREGGFTNVDIMAVHEYGAPEANIPERSFIRSTINAQRAKYVSMLKKALKLLLEKRLSSVQMFDILGAQMIADINYKVRVEGGFEPLKQATIDRKGSTRALIDTGAMLASLAWVTVFGERKVSSG